MTPSKGNASILEWTSPGSDTTSSEGDLSTSSIISYLGSDSQSSDGILSTTSSNSSSPQSFSRGGQGSKLVLPRGPTSTLLPVESLHLSELPRSVPQLVAEIEEWKQDLSRTELELKSVSEESFLSLRPRLTDLEMSETSSQYFILKAMYTSQLQQVELSKLSWVNWSASQNFVRMILDEIQNIGGDTERGLLWSNTLSLKISDGELEISFRYFASSLIQTLISSQPQVTSAVREKVQMRRPTSGLLTWRQTAASSFRLLGFNARSAIVFTTRSCLPLL